MRLRSVPARLLAPGILFAVTTATYACSGGASLPSSSLAGRTTVDQPVGRSTPHAPSGKITHIVIVMQENQSFDHLFNGYPGADTAQSGLIHTGATVPLTMQNLGDPTGTQHMSSDFLTAYDGGRMDGFDLNTEQPTPNLLPYTYVNPTEIGPYLQMAQQYVLADRYFTSHIDASFVAHQYMIAAQANHSVNLPTGSWGCANGGKPDFIPTLKPDRTVGLMEPVCFDYTTLADELDAAGLTWRFYAPYIACPPSRPKCKTAGGSWSAFQAVNHIYNGPDWANVISPEKTILTDIPGGKLANVTWVVPDYLNSDHPGSHSRSGPSWVASIVNAIGESPFWNSTAILVTWDEWGGEYDHVVPPHKDYDGDGFRVPLLCISPYAYQGRVDHVPLETAGIPKFVEVTFGLSTMTAADKRAAPADRGCTNPSQTTPRNFTPIQTPLGPRYFLREQPPANVAPDDE